MQKQEVTDYNTLHGQLKHNNKIQVTSSNLLLFHVEDLLGLSQIKAGKFTQIISEFSIRGAVQEVVDVQEYNANQKRVQIELEFHGLNDKAIVKTDKKRLQQVLINLQANAIKFTKSSGLVQTVVTFI